MVVQKDGKMMFVAVLGWGVLGLAALGLAFLEGGPAIWAEDDGMFVRRAPAIFAAMLAGLAGLSATKAAQIGRAAEADPLQLEFKIPLGQVAGRIDHMAIDLTRQRLFVAELGNNSVGVVDLVARKVVHNIVGLKEPQGVGYVPSTDSLYVTNAGDGSVLVFRAEDYTAVGRIDLGDDADNIRVDPVAKQVFVGYGSGALAVIDPENRSKVADIALKGHPESFQLDRGSNRIFANVPDAGSIAVVDRIAAKQTASWPTTDAGGNFPMALDEDAQQVIVVFRKPARLRVFSMRDGAVAAGAETCGDSDDVFADTKRRRVYVSCGEGFLDVFDTQVGGYKRIAHISTVSGARTSLFVPQLDRLLLAVRASAGEPAAIWVYRPSP
jgi:YVTN family beta-propeller protein